jgi:hypothetical protein
MNRLALVCGQQAVVPPCEPEPLAFPIPEQGREPSGHPAIAAHQPTPAAGLTPLASGKSQAFVCRKHLPAAMTKIPGESLADVPPDQGDDLPIVVLDDEAEAGNGLTPEATSYLRSQGITDENTWAAFRLGQVSGLDRERFGLIGRRAAHGGSLDLPTWDPRQPEIIAGVIRMTPAVNRHVFATPPAGLAGPGVFSTGALVVADTPILAMRLHQGGVAGIVVAEDPAVMGPLAGWFAGRSIVIVGLRRRRLEALRDALGPVGTSAVILVLPSDLSEVTSAAWGRLGVAAAVPAPAAPVSPALITPHLIRDILAYAQDRLARGDGRDLLGSLGADHPDMVAAYGLGVLPPDFGSAFTPAQQQALVGIPLGGSVVVPAWDDQGVAIDLWFVRPEAPGSGLLSDQRGIIAPRIAQAHASLIITDDLRDAGRLFHQGHGNVLFVRNAADVHADRLALNGVRAVDVQVRHQAESITTALRAAGISVGRYAPSVLRAEAAGATERAQLICEEPVPALVQTPTPSTVLTLVEHDTVRQLATFAAGPSRFVVEVPWDASTRLEVTLRHGGQVQRDRFDLASDAQRQRFASGAALRCGLAAETIAPLLVDLLDAVRGLQVQAEHPSAPPTVAVHGSAHDAAMAMLTAPDLLARLVADLDHLGWVGEDAGKRLLYLASISRKLPDPVWAVLSASPGAGKSHGLDLVTACAPPEDVLQVSRLTDAALYHQDAHALTHKLLVIDEADALTPEVIVALRVLKTRGALSVAQAPRPGSGPGARGQVVEARGPVAVLTSTAGTLEDQLASRCLHIVVDESPEQTARVVAAQRRMHAQASRRNDRSAILQRHRDVQRLLACRPVVIPYAERIRFPAVAVHHRRDHERFLGLIEASALLHQHQRLTDQGCIVADERDFRIAADLAEAAGIATSQGLGRQAGHLLAALWQAQRTAFTMDDLGALCPHWTRYAFRAALDDLMRLDYIASPPGGRGKLREYRLVAAAQTATESTRICLVAADAVAVGTIETAKLAKLAEVGENIVANLTPVRHAG